MIQDFKVVQDNQAYWDLEINTETKDFSTVEGMETAVFMQQYCDKRSTKEDIGIARDRQGWIGDIETKSNGYELGSLIYLKGQSRNTPLDLLEIANYAKEALNYFVIIGAAKEVTAEVVENNINGIINIDADQTLRYSKLWRSTIGT